VGGEGKEEAASRGPAFEKGILSRSTMRTRFAYGARHEKSFALRSDRPSARRGDKIKAAHIAGVKIRRKTAAQPYLAKASIPRALLKRVPQVVDKIFATALHL